MRRNIYRVNRRYVTKARSIIKTARHAKNKSMKKLVLMKYLNAKGIPEYRSMPKIDMPDNEVDNRKALMEVEAEEMLYTGEMKEKLWIKSLNEEEYKQLMKDESKERIRRLEDLNKVWEEA